MKVWLTGASGMLGQAVASKLKEAGILFVPTDLDVDITSGSAVSDFAQSQKFSHLVNCAAYTAVDQAESDEGAAYRVNRDGVRNLARAAIRHRLSLVHVSTDYVFDGEGNKPYAEESVASPLGVYGASKWAGEQALCEEVGGLRSPSVPTWIVRTSWLFGPGGPNFVRRMLELFQEREELLVVNDQWGRPSYAPDLADGLLTLSGVLGGGAALSGVYHFANEGALNWHAFAEAILKSAGPDLDPLRCQRILPIPTSQFPRPAPRPKYSVLCTDKLGKALGAPPRPWSAALGDYLEAVKAAR